MRIRDIGLFAVGGMLLFSGCAQEYDAADQRNTRAMLSTRDEMTLRVAAASDAAGDLADAERQYIQVSKNGTPQSAMELAGFYSRHNDSGRAVEVLQAAYAKHPDDMNLMRSLANALITAGNPEKALGMLDGALSKHNDLAYIYNSRGVALDKLGRYDEAQKSYLKAIALNPQEDVDFKTNLSMSYILAGRDNDAVKLLSPLVAQKRATPAVRQNLALAYGLKGDMKMAMKVGSKDLTAQQMNENIRFYALVTKRGIKHDGPSYAASEPADVFPTIAPPPTPIAEIPASEDAPPITGLTGEPAQPVAADAPPTPAIAVPSAPQQVAALPAEPVRNLSPAPQVASPALIYGPAPATPEVKPVVEKIIKPEPQPDVTTARRKAPTIQPTETDDDTTTTASDTAPPATDGIPVPVLKPDKW